MSGPGRAAARPPALRALAGLLLALVLASAADARPWSWLGVRIRDLSEHEMEEISKRHGIREGFGVMIVEVMDDTPAARAGMKNGDIVVAFEGRPVTETRLLQRLIAGAPPERETKLTVLRPEGRTPLPVRLVSMPRAIAGERVAAEYGFVMRESDAPAEPGGRRPAATVPSVTFVVRGSAAEKAGLRVGDVIVEIDEQPIADREAARHALAGVTPERPLRLTVRRAERDVSLTVPAP